MCQDSAYIKSMFLGFQDNRVFVKQNFLSPFSTPPLLPLFSSTPKSWVSPFHTPRGDAVLSSRVKIKEKKTVDQEVDRTVQIKVLV